MNDAPVRSPSVEVTHELVRDLVARGGYTHPLFHPAQPDAPTPLPGQGLLLLMGGLAEQSGALDRAVAMLELRRVRFERMVLPGTTVSVRITPGATSRTASGRLLREYDWTAVDGRGEVVARAEVLMMMQPEDGDEG